MIERAVEALGSEFICYILARERTDLDSFPVNEKQSEVLTYIAPVIEAILSRENEMDRHLARMFLLKYSDEQKGTVARIARQHCGGSVLEIGSDDPIENELLHLGIDLYATLLLPAYDDEIAFIPPSLPLHGHPLNRTLAIEIARDETLSKLFPDIDISRLENGTDADFYRIPSSHLMWSNGQGGSAQLATVPSAMLQYAFDICAILDDRSEQGLLNALRETVATCRKLATGKRTPVRAVARLSNVTLAPEIPSASLGAATIRTANKSTNYLFMGEEGSATLEFKIDLKLLNVTVFDGASNNDQEIMARHERARPAADAFQNEVKRQIDRSRFALLLASDKDNLIAPAHTSTSILNPLTVSRSASTSIYRFQIAPLPAQELTSDKSTQAQEWARRIQSQPGSVDMGMRRLLAAVSSRMDAMDGFVDAVICWENLFGTPEGESTFRVSGAMAILLEPHSAEKRKMLMNEIRDLYRVRSRLVHGSHEPDLVTAYKHRNRAVELALSAFQTVYDNDHLLQAENSSIRSRIALLGF